MRAVCSVSLASIHAAGHQAEPEVLNKLGVKETPATSGQERLFCACSKLQSASCSGCSVSGN